MAINICIACDTFIFYKGDTTITLINNGTDVWTDTTDYKMTYNNTGITWNVFYNNSRIAFSKTANARSCITFDSDKCTIKCFRQMYNYSIFDMILIFFIVALLLIFVITCCWYSITSFNTYYNS